MPKAKKHKGQGGSTKFRPCIDLHKGKVKSIVGDSYTDSGKGIVENFVSDKPSSFFAQMYKNDDLTGGHISIIGQGNEEQALLALKTYPNGLQVGGGINLENANFFLENGASHIIVTSFIFNRGQLNLKKLEQISSLVGKNRLVLDLSCKKMKDSYFVATDKWQKISDFEVNEKSLSELSNYCDEYLIHSVSADGKHCGVDAELLQNLSKWAKIPCTYGGGIRGIEDLELIRKIGKGKIDATIGTALSIFGGKMDYKQVLGWFREHG